MNSSPNAWVLCTGEALPIDPGRARILRAGMLCSYLETQGYNVDFWTSNFNHAVKKHRIPARATVTYHQSANYRIHLLPSNGYNKNVSFARIIDHRQIAKAFLTRAGEAPKPNILIISMPTIDLAYAGAHYAHSRNIPYILDLRDMWPEIFYMDRSWPARQMIKLLSSVWSVRLNWALLHAHSVVGITDAFVDWGCHRSGRQRNLDRDLALPLAYPPKQPIIAVQETEQRRLIETGLLRPDRFQVMCIMGSITSRSDIATVCNAVIIANEHGIPVHLVIAGSGEGLDSLSDKYSSQFIKFLGRVDEMTLQAILRTSKVGVVPYYNSLDFQMSIPNKAIEYLSHGCPILTSLQGTLSELIRDNRIGLIYEEGDAESLANLFSCYYNNTDQLHNDSTRSMLLFNSNFSTNIVFNKYFRLVQALVENNMDN